jgi:hypothetical protein
VDAEDPQTGAMFQGNFKVGLDLLYPDYEGWYINSIANRRKYFWNNWRL